MHHRQTFDFKVIIQILGQVFLLRLRMKKASKTEQTRCFKSDEIEWKIKFSLAVDLGGCGKRN